MRTVGGSLGKKFEEGFLRRLLCFRLVKTNFMKLLVRGLLCVYMFTRRSILTEGSKDYLRDLVDGEFRRKVR